jgi:hypothetical protein
MVWKTGNSNGQEAHQNEFQVYNIERQLQVRPKTRAQHASPRLPSPHLDLVVSLPQVMKRFASKLLQKAPSANATAHPDQLTTILDNAMVVFRRVGSTTSNVLELPAAGQIGIEIVEIIMVRLNEDSCCLMRATDSSIWGTENARKSGAIRRTREKHNTDTRRRSEDLSG